MSTVRGLATQDITKNIQLLTERQVNAAFDPKTFR